MVDDTRISCTMILQNVLNETFIDFKIDSNCRIYDKVAVNINQWSLTKLDENSPLIETIERNLEPFIKK